MEERHIVAYIENNRKKKVKIAVTDIDGILRGKYINSEKFISSMSQELGFCGVIFEWDIEGMTYSEQNEKGEDIIYADETLKVDLQTFRKIPWENDVPFFLCELKENSTYICPRSLLKQVVKEAEDLGFFPYFSQELEWFNFLETPTSIYEKDFKSLTPLSQTSFGYSTLQTNLKNDYYDALFELLTKFDIPVETLHSEGGLGVLEISTKYSDALSAADNAVLLKMGVKQIAYKHGVVASFMAKLYPNSSGCGGHIHQSIWDKDKKHNLFYEKNAPKNLSKIFKHYLAGQLHCLPYILPMFAPTVNSYKRLKEESSAPTRATWGMDNRLVALRVLANSAEGTRLETRLPGADTNPYLVIAACLASGLYGIKHELELQPCTLGNGHKDLHAKRFASNLYSAIELMKNSPIANELFGEKFTQQFIRTREWEWLNYQNAVTDWEIKRYFERI